MPTQAMSEADEFMKHIAVPRSKGAVTHLEVASGGMCWCCMLHCGVVCYILLQCGAVCDSVVQCGAVWCATTGQ